MIREERRFKATEEAQKPLVGRPNGKERGEARAHDLGQWGASRPGWNTQPIGHISRDEEQTGLGVWNGYTSIHADASCYGS